MIKKLLVMVLFLLILPFVSAVVSEISINPTSHTITADISEEITKTITLTNSNTTDPWTVTLPGSINFVGTSHNLTDIPASYNVSGSSYIIVGNSSSETINYTFSVPSDAYAESYNGVLNFTTASAEDYAELSLALTVNADHNITVNDIALEIAQGQTGTSTLTLTNNGNIDETAALPSSVILTSTSSTNTITASITDTSLDVDYKETNSTTVTVDVPADAAKETYEGNVSITYGANIVKSLVTINVVEPSYSINTGTIAFPLVTTPNSTISKTFLIENTGNAALTNLVLSSNVASRYNLAFNQTTISNLGIDESKEIKIDVFVPYKETIGNHSIGTVDVSYQTILDEQQNFTSAYNVYIDVEAKLDVEDLDVFIDGDQESNVEDEEKVGDKAEPGSEIELKIKLKNTFSEDSDIDINDITVTVTLIDPDDDDIDEMDVDIGDLDADEKSDEESIVFELPLDVEEGEYIIEIEIEGEDDNGVKHDLDWNVYFELEKKSHEIIIYKAYLTPEKIKCTRTSSLYVKLMNTGGKTEDEVRLTITNSDFNINIDKRDLELTKNPDDDDNTYTEEVIIDAKDKAAGSYPIVIKAYYDEDLLDDVKTINLVVEDCPKPSPKKDETIKEEEKTTVVVQQPSEQNVTVPVTTGEEIPTTTEISFIKSTGGVVLLLLGNVVVLVVVVFLIAKIFFIPKIPKP